MTEERRSRGARRLELERTRSELEAIRFALGESWQAFDLCADPALTEAHIYEINALRSRYDAVFRHLKSIAL